jgi:hypothetical protein
MVKFDVMRTIQAFAYMSGESYKVLQHFIDAGLSLLGPSDVTQHHMCHHVCSTDIRELSWVSSVLRLSFMLSHLVPSIKPRHEKVCQIAILNALRTTVKSVAR